jgi:hypothetical protein
MRKTLSVLLVAAALVAAALIAVGGSLSGAPRWSPDGLFYQARSLEFQGAGHAESLQQTFQGPLGAELRRIDPTRSGSPSWVSFNAQFYERRVAMPVAATNPVKLRYPTPMRELLAQMLNDAMPVADPSWGFIAGQYPGAIFDLLRADGGFVRDGAWYSAAYLIGGLLLLFGLARGDNATPWTSLLKAGAVAGIAYVLVIPIFSAFRLELGLVPFAAFGLALAAERVAERIALPSLVRRPTVAGSGSGA